MPNWKHTLNSIAGLRSTTHPPICRECHYGKNIEENGGMIFLLTDSMKKQLYMLPSALQ